MVMLRIGKEKVREIMQDKLVKHGTPEEIAKECATLLVENSIDGIYSHGVNRFPRIISYLDKGYIKAANVPTMVASYGAMEKWDGNLGMGNTNAKFCMDRAIKLAHEYGIGCVAIRHTNHWMRGGTYGLQAANAGCIGICWTNTQPNMPAWGGKDRRIGNNPLIFCIPKKDGHVMMDGAMAQFSYGAIESAKLAGKQLPVPGGFDTKGNVTCDPAEIEKTWRVLPIGYWKGSCISIVLDMVAATLSEGNSVSEVGKLGDDEFSLSQVLIAIDIKRITPAYEVIVQRIIDDIKASELVDENAEILYPNELCNISREDNLKNGIPVHENVWETIMAL
jgi:3-dehydro-L-gulonate 2-dehydrogenase